MTIPQKDIQTSNDKRLEELIIKGKIDEKIDCNAESALLHGTVRNKLVEKNNTTSVDIDDCVFSEVAMEWLNLKTPQLKASSVAKYTNLLILYVLPVFGNILVSDISRYDLISLSHNLLISGGANAKGLSPKTVNSVLSIIKSILEFTSREKRIQTADTKNLSVKQSQKPMRILSKVEQQRLSKYLRDNPTPCNIGILLCLYTGLRLGEICALTWSDILIEEQCLYIHKTMQRIQIKENSGKRTKIIVQSPKSDCSIRKIPIPNEIFKMLLILKCDKDAFLLTGVKHNYIEPRSMENRFKNVTDKCNINKVSFHSLRHTFATRCVELGFDIKSLSEILGHASVSITMNRYVHPSMEYKQRNMNLLSKLLDKETY